MALIQLPKISGTIDRRILINYRVPAEVVAKMLPPPFEPLVIEGYAIVGICLIRLVNMRPDGKFKFLGGLTSENAAHRIGVRWPTADGEKEGVYIPRRDTSSRLVSLFGGRLFPGVQHYSKFNVQEGSGEYRLSFSHRGKKKLSIFCKESTEYPKSSVFKKLGAVSDFFQKGSLGYSPNLKGTCYSGMELETKTWSMSPLETQEVYSAYFTESGLFPNGSVEFDNAVLMKKIPHSDLTPKKWTL